MVVYDLKIRYYFYLITITVPFFFGLSQNFVNVLFRGHVHSNRKGSDLFVCVSVVNVSSRCPHRTGLPSSEDHCLMSMGRKWVVRGMRG